jgi:DNA gyrase inhibitor GyrI
MKAVDVRIKKLLPMRVARFHALGSRPEQEAWARLREWAGPQGLLKDATTHPVFGFNNPGPTPTSSDSGYELWIRIAPEMRVETGIKTLDFSGGWYAVATHYGLPNPDAWMRLLTWVRNSPYHHRPTHELEHPHDPLATESEMVFDLCLPVEIEVVKHLAA